MAVVFRPTSAAAVALRKHAERLGRQILAGATGVATQLHAGFLLRALRASPDTAIVTAIDLPRFYGAARLRSAATEGTTMVIKIEVDDALSYLIDGYTGGPPAVLPTEGYYAGRGVVYIGAQEVNRASLAVRAGPATACRTALLVVDSIAIANSENTAVVGFTFQVNRVNASTSWINQAPPGANIDRLPMNPTPQVVGGPAVIEISPEELNILRLQPYTSAPNKVVAGPALEVDRSTGFVTGSALFEAGLVPGGSDGRIDEHCVVARYSVNTVPAIDGEPQPHEGVVDWVIDIKPMVVPAGMLEHTMYSPHIWGAWSVFADTRPEPETPLSPILMLVSGSYLETFVDPEIVDGIKRSSYNLRLVVDPETGAYTESLVSTFDAGTLEYTQLEEEQYTPILPFTRTDAPCILYAKRIIHYDVVPQGGGLVDRKEPTTDYFYTKLADLSYQILTETGMEPVDLGAYYIAVGARFVAPTILGTGRFAYSGPFVRASGGTLGGEYFPVEGSNVNGGNPIGSAVCLCAPGILAVVVSPTGQYLSGVQDRFVMLYDVINHTVLQVSTVPLLGMAYGADVLFQLTCLERGAVDEDGVLTSYPILLLTVGQLVVGTGVYVTYDAGETTQKILDYPNQAAAYYLGSPSSPASIGESMNQPGIPRRSVPTP